MHLIILEMIHAYIYIYIFINMNTHIYIHMYIYANINIYIIDFQEVILRVHKLHQDSDFLNPRIDELSSQ